MNELLTIMDLPYTLELNGSRIYKIPIAIRNLNMFPHCTYSKVDHSKQVVRVERICFAGRNQVHGGFSIEVRSL